MRCKLTSVVRGNSPDWQLGLSKQPHHGMRQRYGLFSRFKSLHEHITALPVHQRYDGTFSILSHDGVHFPIAYGTTICLDGPFVNRNSVRYQCAARHIRCPALVPAMAKVFPDIILTVRGTGCYPIIDSRLGDLNAFLSPKPAGNFLGGPLLMADKFKHTAADIRLDRTVARVVRLATASSEYCQMTVVDALLI